MNDTFGNITFSETSKNLLTQLRAKDITLEQFLRECAYWALKDGFDELRPYSFPTAPTTQAFTEYETLPPERKTKVDSDFFRKNYEIIEYYQQVLFIRHRNNGNLEWLEKILNHLPEEDFVMRKRIENRIMEFRAFADNNPLMAEKIKSIFKAKEINPQKKSYYSAGEIINDLS